MCRRLRTTFPLAQEQRVPTLPDPTVLSNKHDQVKWRQKKNFDADQMQMSKGAPYIAPGIYSVDFGSAHYGEGCERDRSTILCGGDTRWELQMK